MCPPPSAAPKELFPCAPPYPDVKPCGDHVKGLSRAVRSREKARVGRKLWANSAVESLNEILGRPASSPSSGSDGQAASRPSAAQELSLSRIRQTFENLPKAECMNTAAAFQALCDGRAGYEDSSPATQARYRRGSEVSLPPVGRSHAQPREFLRSEDLDAWCRWREVLLRSPAERDAALAQEGNP